MSIQTEQPLIRTKNYLDLNNDTQDSHRQVVLEVNKSSMAPSEHLDNHVDQHPNQEPLSGYSTPEEDPEIDNEPQPDDTIDILRDLLSIERHRNKQRRDNYKTLQGYLTLLQSDYLRLAQELVDTLEATKKIKNEKDVFIATLESSLRERDDQIRNLKVSIAEVANLRSNFNKLLKEQVEVEREQYENQKQVLEQQMVRERVNNSQILQQFQERLDEQAKLHRVELDSYRSRLKLAEQERNSLLSEPQNELVRLMLDDKVKLTSRINELEFANQEAGIKYETLRKKSELLQKEVEVLEHESKDEFKRLQECQQDLRLVHQEKLLELEDKSEIIQVLKHSLNQAERRAINLLSVLKDKELAWDNLMKQTEIRHEETLIKTKGELRALNKKSTELEVEVEQKQNELVKCQMEQENQLDSIRADRDQRLNRLQAEKNRLEQEVRGTEFKFASEMERNSRLNEENSKMLRDLLDSREEVSKLSLMLASVEALAESRLRELNSVADTTKSLTTTPADVLLELDEVKRANERLEKRAKELKRDNQKLLMKLKVNESSLMNISSALKREQTKLMAEHEKKLASIKQQQVVYDKSQTKYRRYGSKLKKYCEHLSQVHMHLCNPLECSYQQQHQEPSGDQDTRSERSTKRTGNR